MEENQTIDNKVIARSILELNSDEAKNFFLKEESYCTIIFPKYYTFKKLLTFVSKKVISNSNFDYNNIKTFVNNASKLTNVNRKIIFNKDALFSWRQLDMINPVLYGYLVNTITEKTNWNFIINRLTLLRKLDYIECFSLPISTDELNKNSDKAYQINEWIEKVEKKSIEFSLSYCKMYNIDIENCYGNLYTHTISWAIHGKESAKKDKENKEILGNILDRIISSMNNGQTNGIPQGSVIMDFIAEIVLAFADYKIENRLKEMGLNQFKIIRYRDDYRIFVNNSNDGFNIVKEISIILKDLNFKINSSKSKESNSIIKDSMKSIKYEWITNENKPKGLLKRLLKIHRLNDEYPNQYYINSILFNFYKRLNKLILNTELDINTKNFKAMISILIDISLKSPISIHQSYSCISLLLTKTTENDEILKFIEMKLESYPNSTFNLIWLQRITKQKQDFKDEFLNSVFSNNNIWNNDFIQESLKESINKISLIDYELLESMPPFVEEDEIKLFSY